MWVPNTGEVVMYGERLKTQSTSISEKEASSYSTLYTLTIKLSKKEKTKKGLFREVVKVLEAGEGCLSNPRTQVECSSQEYYALRRGQDLSDYICLGNRSRDLTNTRYPVLVIIRRNKRMYKLRVTITSPEACPALLGGVDKDHNPRLSSLQEPASSLEECK